MAISNLVPWRRSSSMMTPSASPSFMNLEGPFSSISSLQREMNRMFNNIWSSPTTLDETSIAFYPDVEMSETDGQIEISAELPGVSEKDIDVTLSPDGSTISIRGEKKLAKEKQEKDYYCAERSYGAFRRTMTLPSPVNPDKVDAKFHHGVLEIKLNKSEDASKNVKHIDIQAG